MIVAVLLRRVLEFFSLGEDWVIKVKSHIRPFASAARENSRRMLLSGLLTAVIVFCGAVATAITADPAKIGLLTFVCAGLSAIVAFCQSILDVWRREHE